MKNIVYRKQIAIAIIVMILCTFGLIVYRQFLRPLPFSTPIGNTTLYIYTDDVNLTTTNSEVSSPDDAATVLAELYLNDMMNPSDNRTFKITKYKNLKVNLYPTLDMDKETADIYFLQDYERAINTWIMEIDVMFQYEGILSPIGSVENEWIDGLYQASPIGFLLVYKDSEAEYTMQSRYIPKSSY